MRKINYGIIETLVISIFSLSIFSMNEKQESVIATNSNIASNQKIEWGIKRNNTHEQPDVGSNNKKILEENNGICLGNSGKKNLYLTFDQGYEAQATFFITAHYVNSEPDLVKQMIDEGHIVGNHIPLTLMTLF